jgi:hypothetical protein
MLREGWQWHPFALAKDITDSPARLAFGRRDTPNKLLFKISLNKFWMGSTCVLYLHFIFIKSK